FVIGVNDVRIARVRDDVAAFAPANGVPVAAIDEAVVAARSNADGRIVLLGAVYAVQKIVVGGDVVELRGRLVILRGPIFSPVHGDGGTAVVAVDEAIGIVGINPEGVVVAVGG